MDYDKLVRELLWHTNCVSFGSLISTQPKICFMQNTDFSVSLSLLPRYGHRRLLELPDIHPFLSSLSLMPDLDTENCARLYMAFIHFYAFESKRLWRSLSSMQLSPICSYICFDNDSCLKVQATICFKLCAKLLIFKCVCCLLFVYCIYEHGLLARKICPCIITVVEWERKIFTPVLTWAGPQQFLLCSF